MKPIALHPGSLAAGAALAAVLFVVAGAQTPVVESVIDPAPRVIEHHIVGIPDPRDVVLIMEENGPYTVPSDKVLLISGFGSIHYYTTQCALFVDGAQVALGNSNQGQAMFTPLPVPGIQVRAGSVVSFSSSNNTGRAIGYLSDL